jgi:hypothetical protein
MSPLPSRKIGAAFVGVFLIGATVGALLVTTFQDMRFPRFLTMTGNPTSMGARINQKYLKEYQLSPAEEARVAPLTQDMADHLYLIRRQFGVDILATLDDYHQKIGEQMTPDHRSAFEKTNEERKKRMSSILLLDAPGAAPK